MSTDTPAGRGAGRMGHWNGYSLAALAALVLVPALGLGWGCAANSLRPLSDRADAAAIVPIAAGQLFDLQEQQGTYERVEGDRSGREYDYTLTAHDAETWRLEIGDRHRIYLIEESDGTISATRYVNVPNDVEVHYDPALPMLPGQLDGAVHEGRSQMRVTGLLGRRQMSGSVNYRLQAIDMREVDTHRGPEQGYVIEQYQQLRLPLARAEIVLETSYVPGLGRVKDSIERKHRVLGLFGDQQQEIYERIE